MPENDKESSKTLSHTYVGFIDVLFAVVLGQSFVLLIDENYYGNWFSDPAANAFGMATLLLVYGLVISSWVGYHQSVRVYPLKSVWRFLIDVILLFLYYLAFANAANFDVILRVLWASFGAYTAWDTFRIYEYRKDLKPELWKRLICSGGFFVIFLVSYFLFGYIHPLVAGAEYAFWVASVVFLVLYRKIKWYKKCD